MWHEIIDQLRQHNRFIISSHQNPDCDALGSELALAEHLRNLGKTVHILNSDPTPDDYQFLDPQKQILIYNKDDHRPLIQQVEAIIVLDASSGWDRLGAVGSALGRQQALTLCIDHHLDPAPFAQVMQVEAGYIATAEMIFELVRAMDGELTPLMAQALYAGIITDSGNFRFAKTSPRTHHIAAELLAAGVDQTMVYRRIFEQTPLAYLHLKGHVLQNLQLTFNGQLAYVGLSAKTLRQFGVTAKDVNGFSGVGLEVEGVRMSVFALELAPGRVKLSLRSDGSIPVNKIAAGFGGGGHQPAAGATVSTPLPALMKQVLARSQPFFNNGI